MEIPVHACDLHQSCTIGKRVEGLHCCYECPDRRPEWVSDAAGTVRHLTYFAYPRGEIAVWNLTSLLQRMSLFNGRRIVALATDEHADQADTWRRFLALHDVEVLEYRNDPHRKEQVATLKLLEAVSDLQGEKDVTFYGHAKGIGSSLVADGVRTWASEMYRGNLDYWPAVKRALREHCCCGVLLRRTRHPPGVPVQWHYSGSFRWVRNHDVYRRNWQAVPEDWGAPEMWPGLHFGYHEAACLYGEAVGYHGWWYRQADWDAWGTAFAAAWRAQHVADRWEPLLCTVLLTVHRQDQQARIAIESVLRQTSDSWQLLILDSGAVHGPEWYACYAGDARVKVRFPGTQQVDTPKHNGQAWAYNEAWRREWVRGDVVVHLCDDQELSPNVVEALLARAAANPAESAWYGSCARRRVRQDGSQQLFPLLSTCGVLTPANSGRGRVDGMQIAHRRTVRSDWPENSSVAAFCDGCWMDEVAKKTPIIPLSLNIGVSYHTPMSRFTK